MVHAVDLEKIKFHLLAVSVAADLSDVKAQGEAISLEAMNAKVLVARAGSMGLGFRPITDFMVQLAEDTIRLVREIEAEALAVAHQAVERLRTANAVKLARKAEAISRSTNAKWGDQLRIFVEQVNARDQQTVSELLGHAQRLTKLLDEIASQMLAARAVSSSIRIESATIEARHSQSFQSVANNLQDCSSSVLTKVKSNLRTLNRALNS